MSADGAGGGNYNPSCDCNCSNKNRSNNLQLENKKLKQEKAKLRLFMDNFKKNGGGTNVDPEYTAEDAELLRKELQESFDKNYANLTDKKSNKKSCDMDMSLIRYVVGFISSVLIIIMVTAVAEAFVHVLKNTHFTKTLGDYILASSFVAVLLLKHDVL